MQDAKYFHHLRSCKVVEHPRLTKTQIVVSGGVVYCGDAYSFIFLLTSATERKNSLEKGAEICIELAKLKIERAVDEMIKMHELVSEAKQELGIK